MYELVDLKQDYDNATFEKPRLNSICEKASDNFFWSNSETHQLSPFTCVKVKNSGIFMTCLMYLTITQGFN